MGNQARQSQELELWEVVSSPASVRGGQTRPRRSSAQTRSEMHRRGNTSGHNRTTAGNTRQAGAVRAGNAGFGNPGSAGAVSTGNTRPTRTARPRNVRQAGVLRSGNVRAGNVRTVQMRSAGSAGSVRTGNIRPVNPRTGAKTQTSRKKKPGRRARVNQILAFMWIAAMTAAIVFMGKNFYQSMQKSPVIKEDRTQKPSVEEELPLVDEREKKPQIREDFLTVSEYNRPGTKLEEVNNIFVHYTANPGTSAAQNRSYFESLGQTHERAASAHFIIGYEGEIVQCIPLDEEAYAVVERNGDSISIECCYLEKDGSFTQETYDSLIEMLAWLTDKYDLESKDILRHYDCGGKKCPIYYVEHEDAWQRLLDDVEHFTL